MTAYGGQPTPAATVAVGSDGHAYDGTDPTLLALTPADITDLQTNFPHQVGLTQDQYDAWLISAYNCRHRTDNNLENSFWTE